MCTRTETNAHIKPYTPHPKLAIILNPSPAWVIPNNPGLILVNSGHSSAGFHPETTETGLGLVGSWRLRLGTALMAIIGWAVIESQEKQAQVFSRVFKIRPARPPPRHTTALMLSPLLVENMFFTGVLSAQTISYCYCVCLLWLLGMKVGLEVRFPYQLKN